MKTLRITATCLLLLASSMLCKAADLLQPSGTYFYATNDGQDLYLDVYDPAPGSETCIDGKQKPAVLFMFGGGFKSGRRDDKSFDGWFRMLTGAGFRVVSIDYRLGLKGDAGKGRKFLKNMDRALHLAVEDLYSATNFLLDNAEELGIEPDGIVISGSSAGAMTVLQAEWMICNSAPEAAVLPDGFNYAGVMAFAGAIFSKNGAIRYDREPCPTMMCHGTEDNIVTYKKIQLFNLVFAGTDAISKVFSRNGYNYNTFRYLGHTHNISVNMAHDFDKEVEFIEHNVMKGEKRIIDTEIDDPSLEIPEWARNTSLKTLYQKK